MYVLLNKVRYFFHDFNSWANHHHIADQVLFLVLSKSLTVKAFLLPMKVKIYIFYTFCSQKDMNFYGKHASISYSLFLYFCFLQRLQ